MGENRRLILAVLPFGVCALMGFSGGGWGWLVLANANLVFVAGRARRGPDRLTPLLADPAPPGQFRASAAYEREGLTTGGDEVALVVVEGWRVLKRLNEFGHLKREPLVDRARSLPDGPDGQDWGGG